MGALRDEPSPELIGLLERLRLADAEQLRSVAPQVRRLAGELPLFQSVWVDALAQARLLTPFQAAEINAGRAERLLVGPYVLERPLPAPGYAACYAARHLESARPVRLLVANRVQDDPGTIELRLKRLLELSRTPAAAELGLIEDAGLDQGRVWAASAAIAGQTAADWMVENGRFPPGAVLEIARQMVVGLLELEQRGLLHADIAANSLILVPEGRVALPAPGLRAIVRPAEGYAYHDLSPEGYDCLAPERIAEGSPASTAADVYACGCLWWQLLTGRPAVPGGNTMAKLRAIQTAQVADVRKLAPETSERFAKTIAACLARDPSARPASFAELRRLLGASTREGVAELAGCIAGTIQHRWASSSPVKKSSSARALTAVAACLLVAAAASWPLWRQAATILNRGEKPAQIAAADTPANATAGNNAAPPKPSARPVDPKNKKILLPLVRDRQVQPASYAPAAGGESPEKARPRSAAAKHAELLLPGGKTLRASDLKLRDGQTVRGEGGQRPLVRLSPDGLLVESEDLVFEDIDFVWEPGGTSAGANLRPALIVLAARQAEFRGCSFHCRGAARPTAAAIAWVGHGSAGGGLSSASPGELALVDCVFSRVAACVDCRARGALAIEIADTLAVAAGPVVRLNRCPRVNEPLSLALDHCTLRSGNGVLEYRYREVEQQPGEISITGSDSAFVLRDGAALLSFDGPGELDRLLKTVQWNGQGCLLAPESLVAAAHIGGKSQTIEEDRIELGGLVRSGVEFAGAAEKGPRASRITHWQAPLRSADPPGAGRHLLFLPE